MNPLQQFLQTVESAETEHLMMSRLNCHAPYLSSIVVGRNEQGGLIRAFLAWPGHPMAGNTLHGELALGIHDHRYPLTLNLINGKVVNTTFEVDSWHGRELNVFEFHSGQTKGPSIAIPSGKDRLSVKENHDLFVGHSVKMKSYEFHTVACQDWAAWLVEEGPVDSQVTTLFSPNESVDTSHLYASFTHPDEVKQHVRAFVGHALASQS